MKKTLAILLAVVLVAVMMPTAIFAGAATDAEKAIWDQLFLKSDGVEIDYDACTLTAGSAVTFKATIPAGGFIQFNQKLSDLVPASDPGREVINIRPSDSTKSDYFVQLVGRDDVKTDIVPVVETNGENPGNLGASSHFYANNSGVYMDRGHLGSAPTLIAVHTNAYWENGLRLRFYQSEGKIVTYVHGTGVKKTSQQTIAELGGENGFFVRIRTRDLAETYTITINSADVSAAYRDGNYILSDRESSVDASSIKCSYNGTTGMSTYTADVTLSGNGSYVQFGKKLTDLFSGASVKITVGENARTDYTSTRMFLQLTGDANGLKDAVPVAEKWDNSSNLPGTDAITWDINNYSGTNYMFGKGSSGIGANMGSSAGNYNNIVNDGGFVVTFGKTADNNVFVDRIGRQTFGADATKYVSYRTTTETNMTDGGYFRLRNGADGARTFTIVVTTKAVRYTDGAYKFSDEGGKLVSTTRTVADGKVSETATVKVSGNGGYVQLDRKLVDLVVGGATVKIATQNNTRAEYEEARFTVQLTADGTAETDIVPVDERTVDPGVVGVSWSFDGASNVMYVGKGSRTNSAFDQSISNKIVPSSGVGLRFNLNQDGTVVYAPTHNPYNASTPEASTKTLAQIGGENGVYFRLRNWLDKETTYVITVTYANVFVADAENGTVTLDKTAALTGETVTATVNAADNYQLKAGSLKYVMNGKEYPITTRVGDESVSNVFTFAMPEDAVTVKAEFVKADAVNVALLGAGLNVVNGELGQDMRFGTRAYRKAGDKTLFLCGNYVLHAQSDLGKAITANGGVVSEDLAEQLVSPAEGQIVKRVPTGVLNDRCTEYVDFTLRIAGVGADAYKDTEYMCVAYTIYKDDVTGELTTYYADACTRSYQGVVDALN